MKINRNIILLTSVLAALAFANVAAKAELVDVNIGDSNIEIQIEGKSQYKDTDILVYILEPNSGTPAYINQTKTDETGKYYFECLLANDADFGDYSGIVRTKTAVVEEIQDIEVNNRNAYLEFMDRVGLSSSSDDIMTAFSDLQFEPALNMDVYTGIDKGILSQYIYNAKIAGQIPQDVRGFNTLLKKLTALTATRQNINGVVANNEFIYASLLGADESLINMYKALNVTGIGNVNSNVTGKEYADCNAAVDYFKKLVYTNHLTNSDISVEDAKAFFMAKASEIGISSVTVEKCTSDVIRSLMLSDAATPELLKTVYETAVPPNGGAGDSQGGNNSGNAGNGNAGGNGGSEGSADSGIYVPNVLVSGTSESKPFDDLSGYLWAEKAITELYENGIVAGKGERLFAPGDMVKREELVAMIVRLFEYQTKGEVNFTDVGVNSWYYDSVALALDAGIVAGISDSEFGTGLSITREDAAVIAFRALRYEGVELSTEIDNVEFTDINAFSDYAVTAVKVLKKNGIVSGYPDGSFNPKGKLTRAETAQILYNVMELRRDK